MRSALMALAGAAASFNARERILHVTADANVAFVLLIAGTLAVLFEFTSPGLILPGVAGGVLALLGVSALSAFPITGTGMGLLLAGVAALLLAVRFGPARRAPPAILATAGTCAMVFGALHLIDGPPEMRIHLATALAAVPPFAGISFVLGTVAVRARRNKAVVEE